MTFCGKVLIDDVWSGGSRRNLQMVGNILMCKKCVFYIDECVKNVYSISNKEEYYT
jgi:hypothetical protein